MLADGRCLFRAIAHGACLRSGEEAPDENRQRELADELRAQVYCGYCLLRKKKRKTLPICFFNLEVFVELEMRAIVYDPLRFCRLLMSF